MKRINYIDVLKAIAIIVVVLYHSGFMPFGYLGVDVFLVISGYLTTKSLSNKDSMISEGWGGYFRFITSRIIRLLPTLLVAGSVCMIAGYFTMIDDTYESLSQSVIATNFFGNNIIEMVASGDYWSAEKTFSPLMHTWYVGLLMQFYLVFPLLFYITKARSVSYRGSLLSLLSVVGVLSILIFLGDTDASRRFYLLPARFFEFAAGAVVALLYKPQDKVFPRWFVLVDYAFLIALLIVDTDVIPANLKLLLVVALTVVLLCSQEILENSITGNKVLAKIGTASFGIFVWHQIILAFYRSIFGSDMTVWTYMALLLTISIVSLMSFMLIEQRTSKMLRSKNGQKRIWAGTCLAFLILNAVTFAIYAHSGVVRDIPELEVKLNAPERGMWAKYNDRIFEIDKPFATNKLHWFVIGNSYGRDFANVIYESELADSVEVSYCKNTRYRGKEYEERFRGADKIFIASKDYTEEMVHDIELLALAFGKLEDVIIVGEKFFGETMTYAYSRRFLPGYYQTRVSVKANLLLRNQYFKDKYGERFVDLFSVICNENGEARVFTDNNMFISSDCRHLTKSGSKYLSSNINWERFK